MTLCSNLTTKQEHFLSAAVSLTHQVPDKVIKLIWANEYVDFAILLNSSITQSDDHYTFRVEKGDGGKPTLTLTFVVLDRAKRHHGTRFMLSYG